MGALPLVMTESLGTLALLPPLRKPDTARLSPHSHSIKPPLFLTFASNLNSKYYSLRSSSRSTKTSFVNLCSQQQINNDNGHRRGIYQIRFTIPFFNLVQNNFLPIALLSGIALGIAVPTLGCHANNFQISKFSTFGVFLISGLTLRGGDLDAAIAAWPVGLLGIGSILLFTPFFSTLILRIRLQPQEFFTGLAIFTCMPTSLSSGVALTQLAGGNSALALFMTIASNLLGVLVVPLSISNFIVGRVGIGISSGFPVKQLVRNLVLTLLVPVILGKFFRESVPGMTEFVDGNRRIMSMFSAMCIGSVPWIQVSKSRSVLLMVKPPIFFIAVATGLLLHLALLCFNAFAVYALSVFTGGSRSKSAFAGEEDAIALVLVASQKTLPVTVAVVEKLGRTFGDPALLILPCVAAHLNQIIIDSFLVSFWNWKKKNR